MRKTSVDLAIALGPGRSLNTGRLVRNAGQAVYPVADGVAPDEGLSGLVLEARQDVAVAIFVDVTLQHFPLRDEVAGPIRAVVVRIVNVLNYRLPGMQYIGVGHVVEK